MLFVWIGAQVGDNWAKATFGVNSVSHIDTEKNAIPEKDTKESRMLRKLIEYVHENRPRHMKVRDTVTTNTHCISSPDNAHSPGRQARAVVSQVSRRRQVASVCESELRRLSLPHSSRDTRNPLLNTLRLHSARCLSRLSLFARVVLRGALLAL